MRSALYLIASGIGLAANSARDFSLALAREPGLPRFYGKPTGVAAMRRAARKRRNVRRNPRSAR